MVKIHVWSVNCGALIEELETINSRGLEFPQSTYYMDVGHTSN